MVLKLIWLQNLQIICYPIIIGSAFKHGKLRIVCVCVRQKDWYIFTRYLHLVQPLTRFPTNVRQDLRQEVVGHIEATLNATAGEVGS